jgi:ornithine cyclodeaminase/alanine dehydrogenase-like protein (mu-crystallin family)
MTLLLSNEDVATALTMPDCLAVIEEGCRELGQSRCASGVRSEILAPTSRDDALYSLLTMSGVVPRYGIGAVRINSDLLTWPLTPDGVRRVKVPAAPHDRYVGLVLLFSIATGEPLAIYPDGIVQRMRVGGTCGVAAKYLARPDARVAALIGTGWQAGAQLEALALVRKLERVRCYSPSVERRTDFARSMRKTLDIDIVAVGSVREAVKGADIVMCATSSMQPVVSPRLIEPGMHVSSLKQLELDPQLAKQADVVVTHVRSFKSDIARIAGADLARDTEQAKGRLGKALQIDQLPDLSDLLLGQTPGRTYPQDITLFLNYAGLGYQFAATGHIVWTRALKLGLGRKFDTDWFTSAVPS